ncbi:MAG: hypothetical protein GY765_12910 [bacterium]|nr:hypothetical protein [bacterium]
MSENEIKPESKKPEKAPFSSPGTDENYKLERHVTRAEIAIIIVAVVTILFAFYQIYTVEGKISEISSNPLLELDAGAVFELRIFVYSTLIIGFVFLGLYFWAKKNPFGASLTALILYLGNWIAGVVLQGTPVARGGLIKILIVAVLLNGVVSGYKYNKQE